MTMTMTLSESRHGVRWCTCAEHGDPLFLVRHFASISDFTAQTIHQLGRCWLSGHLYLSSYGEMAKNGTFIISWRHLNRMTAYVKSASRMFQVWNWRKSWHRCRSRTWR